MRTSMKESTVLGDDLTPAKFASLIAATSPLAWWDANRDLYKDVTLATATADGEAVAGWKDQSGTGYHATQSTAGNRPVYQANVPALNNKPAVKFTAASSHYLIRTGLSGSIIGNLNTYTIYVVHAALSSHVGYYYAEGKSDAPTQFAAIRQNLGAAEGFHRDDASTSANPAGGTTAANGAVHIQTVRRIASNSWSVRQDGVQVGTSAVAPTTTTINQIAIGALVRTTVNLFFDGYIAQVIATNADNFATVEPILAAFYGIRLP